MKNCFDEREKYTAGATQFSAVIHDAVKELFDTYVAAGFSVRELEYVAKWAISDIALDHILRSQYLVDKPGTP